VSANGRLADSELTNVGGMVLATVTARAWVRMVAAAAADGITLSIVRPAGAYRSFFVQGDMKKNPSAYNLSTASTVSIAAPGYSTHGLGNAVDVSSCTGARLAWMLANGPTFGFTRTFGTRDPNHFGHDGTTTGPTTQSASTGAEPIEDFMAALTDAQQIDFYQKVDALYDALIVPGQAYSWSQAGNDRAQEVKDLLVKPNGFTGNIFRPIDVLLSNATATSDAITKLGAHGGDIDTAPILAAIAALPDAVRAALKAAL